MEEGIWAMCEFKVIAEDNQQILAENIVKVTYDKNSLRLVGIFGNTVQLKNAILSEVDVNREILKVLRHPLLGATLKFLTAFLELQNKASYDPSIEELWNRVKSLGEIMLRELWTKYKGVKK